MSIVNFGTFLRHLLKLIMAPEELNKLLFLHFFYSLTCNGSLIEIETYFCEGMLLFFQGFSCLSLSLFTVFFSGILSASLSVYRCFFSRDFDTFLYLCIDAFFQLFWSPSLSLYRCFFPVILKPFSIFVSMLFPQEFWALLYLCIDALFSGISKSFSICVSMLFFQGFRCSSLSVYRCFWLPPDGYLWEINKRSCLPFICLDSSRNVDHFIHCSFTKLEVKTLYFVLWRIMTHSS